MNNHVLTAVPATVLLMLTVAEAVVVETARLTDPLGKFPDESQHHTNQVNYISLFVKKKFFLTG